MLYRKNERVSRESHELKMQSQGRVHESEWRGEQETARRGERKITSNPRTNEGRSTTSEGISKAPIRRLFKHHPSWEKNIKI